MTVATLAILRVTENLITTCVSLSYLLQTPNIRQNIRYSVGLVIVCLFVLILLWLPDLFGGERK